MEAHIDFVGPTLRLPVVRAPMRRSRANRGDGNLLGTTPASLRSLYQVGPWLPLRCMQACVNISRSSCALSYVGVVRCCGGQVGTYASTSASNSIALTGFLEQYAE